MIAFEVSLNGKRLTVAGAEDLSVLTVIMHAVGKLGSLTVKKDHMPDLEIELTVGGLTSREDIYADEHLDWVERLGLSVGDEIYVRVLSIEDTRIPVSREKSKRSVMSIDDEQELFVYAKENYFRLRDKYENKTDATP